MAVPVSSKTLRTWAERLEFGPTALTNPGHGGHRKVELCWINGLCEKNPCNSWLALYWSWSFFTMKWGLGWQTAEFQCCIEAVYLFDSSHRHQPGRIPNAIVKKIVFHIFAKTPFLSGQPKSVEFCLCRATTASTSSPHLELWRALIVWPAWSVQCKRLRYKI